MNEEELKTIWQKNDEISFKKIDFEEIKQKSVSSQNKLKLRIKKEIIGGVILYLALIPVFYFFPKSLFLTPVFVAVWSWYLWELKRIYNFEDGFQTFENLKEILQTKKVNLRSYFHRTRYITYIGSPFLLFLCLVIFNSFEQMVQNPRPFINIVVLVEIVIIIFVELWLWLIYRPYLDEIEDLLRQLD